MIEYVAGFLFNDDGRVVLLIRKNRPEAQRGLLNAVGGKIEKGETPAQAMQREFREEAGLDLDDWMHFATLTDGSTYRVYFFCDFSEDELWAAESMTDEKVFVHSTRKMEQLSLVSLSNVPWLIHMALAEAKNDWPFLIVERAGAIPT